MQQRGAVYSWLYRLVYMPRSLHATAKSVASRQGKSVPHWSIRDTPPSGGSSGDVWPAEGGVGWRRGGGGCEGNDTIIIWGGCGVAFFGGAT